MQPQISDTSTVTETVTTEMAQPIIVDVGRRRASKIKDLKAGEGELWDEVLDVVDEVKDMLGTEAEGKLLLPIILIYEKKTSRQRIERVLFPLASWNDDDDDDDEDDDRDDDDHDDED
jgi:hypothetical protein